MDFLAVIKDTFLVAAVTPMDQRPTLRENLWEATKLPTADALLILAILSAITTLKRLIPSEWL